MRTKKTNLDQTQAGFTLVEMLVAIFISAFMMLAITTVMTNTRKSFDVTDGLTRMQENVRYAMNRLGQDIRMAGYFGCRTDQIVMKAIDVPVEGAVPVGSIAKSGVADSLQLNFYTPPRQSWTVGQADETDTGDYVTQGSAKISVPAELAEKLSALLEANEDVPPQLQFTDCKTGASDDSQYTVESVDGEIVTLDREIPDTAIIEANIAGVSGGDPGALYEVAYPSEMDADDERKMPILYRNGQELVEGIEYIRFLYGVDTDDEDHLPDTFIPWNEVELDKHVIVAIQVGVLAQSVNTSNVQSDDGRAGQSRALKSAKKDFQVLDIDTSDPAVFNLNMDVDVTRKVFTQTFQVRNHGQHRS